MSKILRIWCRAFHAEKWEWCTIRKQWKCTKCQEYRGEGR